MRFSSKPGKRSPKGEGEEEGEEGEEGEEEEEAAGGGGEYDAGGDEGVQMVKALQQLDDEGTLNTQMQSGSLQVRDKARFSARGWVGVRVVAVAVGVGLPS